MCTTCTFFLGGGGGGGGAGGVKMESDVLDEKSVFLLLGLLLGYGVACIQHNGTYSSIVSHAFLQCRRIVIQVLDIEI